jgi:predicted protein tyrosine phosphatase
MAPSSTIHATICALNELDRYSALGVTHVLSILDPDVPEPDVFRTYQPHYRTTLRFHDEIDPAPNLFLPQIEHIEKILAFGRLVVDGSGGDRHVLVHCHMGISRSTAATATLLALMHPDEDDDSLFARLLTLRPDAWPNCLMVELADDLLERRGRLISALGRFYAVQLANRPELGPYMRDGGRGREVDMAACPVAIARS